MLWRGVAAGISHTVQTTMLTRKAKSRLITWSSLYPTLEHFHRHATENETARDAIRAGTLDIVGGVLGVRRFAAVVAIVSAACSPTNVPSVATPAIPFAH